MSLGRQFLNISQAVTHLDQRARRPYSRYADDYVIEGSSDDDEGNVEPSDSWEADHFEISLESERESFE